MSIDPARDNGGGWPTRADGAHVIEIRDRIDEQRNTEAGFMTADELAAEYEAEDQEGMAEARRWVHEAFYPNEVLTVRALRLQRGWSQKMLAERLGTSQPYIARLEQGGEDIRLGTLRRLVAAFDLDMNTLDEALRNQAMLRERRDA